MLFQLPAFLMLVSFDEQKMPSLKDPYLTCEPTMSVEKLRKVVLSSSQDISI
jgi:hypothetical protein